MQHSIEWYRERLQRLPWAEGLTREAILQRDPLIPHELLATVPPGRVFRDFTDFWRYVVFRASRERSEGVPALTEEAGASDSPAVPLNEVVWDRADQVDIAGV